MQRGLALLGTVIWENQQGRHQSSNNNASSLRQFQSQVLLALSSLVGPIARLAKRPVGTQRHSALQLTTCTLRGDSTASQHGPSHPLHVQGSILQIQSEDRPRRTISNLRVSSKIPGLSLKSGRLFACQPGQTLCSTEQMNTCLSSPAQQRCALCWE